MSDALRRIKAAEGQVTELQGIRRELERLNGTLERLAAIAEKLVPTNEEKEDALLRTHNGSI
jgi:hypothetical protein